MQAENKKDRVLAAVGQKVLETLGLDEKHRKEVLKALVEDPLSCLKPSFSADHHLSTLFESMSPREKWIVASDALYKVNTQFQQGTESAILRGATIFGLTLVQTHEELSDDEEALEFAPLGNFNHTSLDLLRFLRVLLSNEYSNKKPLVMEQAPPVKKRALVLHDTVDKRAQEYGHLKVPPRGTEWAENQTVRFIFSPASGIHRRHEIFLQALNLLDKLAEKSPSSVVKGVEGFRNSVPRENGKITRDWGSDSFAILEVLQEFDLLQASEFKHIVPILRDSIIEDWYHTKSSYTTPTVEAFFEELSSNYHYVLPLNKSFWLAGITEYLTKINTPPKRIVKHREVINNQEEAAAPDLPKWQEFLNTWARLQHSLTEAEQVLRQNIGTHLWESQTRLLMGTGSAQREDKRRTALQAQSGAISTAYREDKHRAALQARNTLHSIQELLPRTATTLAGQLGADRMALPTNEQLVTTVQSTLDLVSKSAVSDVLSSKLKRFLTTLENPNADYQLKATKIAEQPFLRVISNVVSSEEYAPRLKNMLMQQPELAVVFLRMMVYEIGQLVAQKDDEVLQIELLSLPLVELASAVEIMTALCEQANTVTVTEEEVIPTQKQETAPPTEQWRWLKEAAPLPGSVLTWGVKQVMYLQGDRLAWSGFPYSFGVFNSQRLWNVFTGTKTIATGLAVMPVWIPAKILYEMARHPKRAAVALSVLGVAGMAYYGEMKGDQDEKTPHITGAEEAEFAAPSFATELLDYAPVTIPDQVGRESLNQLVPRFYGEVYFGTPPEQEWSSFGFVPMQQDVLEITGEGEAFRTAFTNRELRDFSAQTEIVTELAEVTLEPNQRLVEPNVISGMIYPPDNTKIVKVIQVGGEAPWMTSDGTLTWHDISFDESTNQHHDTWRYSPNEILLLIEPEAAQPVFEDLEASQLWSFESRTASTYSIIFDVEKAVALNGELAGDPVVQQLHQELLDQLRDPNNQSAEVQSRIIVENGDKLITHLKAVHHYALSPDKDATSNITTNMPNIEMVADDPDTGYFCTIGQFSVQEYFKSVGVTVITRGGYPMATIKKGGGFEIWGEIGHLTGAIQLPIGKLAYFDGTPPSKEGKTPSQDLAALQMDDPYAGPAVKESKDEHKNLTLTEELAQRSAEIADLAKKYGYSLAAVSGLALLVLTRKRTLGIKRRREKTRETLTEVLEVASRQRLSNHDLQLIGTLGRYLNSCQENPDTALTATLNLVKRLKNINLGEDAGLLNALLTTEQLVPGRAIAQPSEWQANVGQSTTVSEAALGLEAFAGRWFPNFNGVRDTVSEKRAKWISKKLAELRSLDFFAETLSKAQDAEELKQNLEAGVQSQDELQELIYLALEVQSVVAAQNLQKKISGESTAGTKLDQKTTDMLRNSAKVMTKEGVMSLLLKWANEQGEELDSKQLAYITILTRL